MSHEVPQEAIRPTSPQPGPHDLADIPMILAPNGQAHLRPMGPNFYPSLDQDFDQFKGHVLVMSFAFDEPWDTWEVHPHGDEFVYLLEGDTDFVLRVDGADQVLRISRPGDYVMVPRGVWHTARPHTPTRMLFVTPGEGTLNESTPPE